MFTKSETAQISGWESLEMVVSQLEQTILLYSTPDAPSSLEAVHAAILQVRRQLVQATAEAKTELTFELIVQTYQACLTKMIDRVWALDKKSQNDTLRAVLDQALGSMNALLDYWQSVYPRLFSLDQSMPQPRADHQSALFWDRWASLRLVQLDRWPSKEQLNALENEMKSLTNRGERGALSFHLDRYLDQMISALADYVPHTDSLLPPLLAFTIEGNFNTRGWTVYVIDWIRSILSAWTEPEDRWEKLQECLKTLTQLPIVSGSAVPTQPSLRHHLEVWLQAEAEFLEKMALRHSPIATPMPPVKKEKESLVTCTASVDQLGVFFRAARELGLLKAPSLKALFDGLAPQLSTVARRHVSAESMRSKSYSPEKRDIEQLKDLLMQLFKQVNTY